MAINGHVIFKLPNTFLTNANMPQDISFLVVGYNLISFGRTIDMHGYIVDNILVIKEYIDTKNANHFAIKN
jgi:hypothetical protein